MGGTLSAEEEVGFTIERNNVRTEKSMVSQKRILTPKEAERLREKREQVKAIREQNKMLTLRTRQRMELSQKLATEFNARNAGKGEKGEEEELDGSLFADTGRKGRKNVNARFNRFPISPQKKKEHSSAVLIQSIWRAYKVRKVYGMMGKRTLVAKELLETEKDYIQYLQALVNIYYHPLRDRAESDTPLLTVEEVRTIFPQLEFILLYNKQLYEVLDERIRVKWTVHTTIGDAFLALIDFLKPPYTHYISQFPVITQQIKEASKRIRVLMFLNAKKNLPECGGLDLIALASMPFQRIPRYILLLKEIVANTHATHPDYEHLTAAISKMDVLAKTANEQLRELESQRSIMNIASRLEPPIGNLMKPFRKLLREGIMKYKVTHSTRRTAPGFRICNVFLFTDCLLVAEPLTPSVSKLFITPDTVSKLRPIEVINLKNSTVLDVQEDYKDRNTNCYDFRVHSLQVTVIFEVEILAIKEAWVTAIAQAINSLTETAISYKSKKVRRKSVAYAINRKSASVRLPPAVAKALLAVESDFSSLTSPDSRFVRSHPLEPSPPSTPHSSVMYTPSIPSTARYTTTRTYANTTASSYTTPSATTPPPTVPSPAPQSVAPSPSPSPSPTPYQNPVARVATPTASFSTPTTPRGHLMGLPNHGSGNFLSHQRVGTPVNQLRSSQTEIETKKDDKKDATTEVAEVKNTRAYTGGSSLKISIATEEPQKSAGSSLNLNQKVENVPSTRDASVSNADDFPFDESYLNANLETADEMAVRITTSLEARDGFGITRTYSDNELNRRKSLILPSITLHRSASLSELDGLLA